MPTPISKHFNLEDLTITSHTGIDNTPDPASLANLTALANNVLDPIYDQIGPFTITSGYRSPALNAAIQGAGAPASSTSYHMQGLAADMLPSNTDPFSFFVAILASPLFGQVGELINESADEGIIHISSITPAKTSVAMYLQNGNYYRYSQDDINNMTSAMAADGTASYTPETFTDDSANAPEATADDNADTEVMSYSPTTLIIVAVAAFLVLGAIMAARQAGESTNQGAAA